MWNWRGNRTGWHVYWSPDDPAGGQAQGSGTGASSAGTQNTEHMIPKSRFDEVNARLKQIEAEREKEKADLATAEQERLKKQGEWQKVAETSTARVAELEPYQARAIAAEAVITKANDALIVQIPEDIRESIVPKGLPAHELYAWLNANVPILLKRPAPNIDAGAGGGGSGTPPLPLTAEEKRAAAATGMTEQQWRDAKKKAEGAG